MKNSAKIILTLLLAALLMAACSREESELPEVDGAETGRIEEMTTDAAEAVVRKVRTPLEKARGAANLGDDRVEEMDRAVREQ